MLLCRVVPSWSEVCPWWSVAVFINVPPEALVEKNTTETWSITSFCICSVQLDFFGSPDWIHTARFHWEEQQWSHRKEAHRSHRFLVTPGTNAEPRDRESQHWEAQKQQLIRRWRLSRTGSGRCGHFQDRNLSAHLSYITGRHDNSCAICSYWSECATFLQQVKVILLQLVLIFVGDQFLNLKVKIWKARMKRPSLNRWSEAGLKLVLQLLTGLLRLTKTTSLGFSFCFSNSS